MKKRVFAAIMTTVLVLASVMGVSAANSKEAGVTVTNKSETETYVIKEEIPAEIIKEIEGGQDTIDKINKSDVSVLPADVQKELKGLTVIANVFDLDTVEGSHAECEKRGYHEVTLVVDSLTEKMDKNSVKVLHFDAENGWEIVELISVDLAKKTIVAKFVNFSPVAVFAEPVQDSAEGTSPSTEGTSSAWMLWAALAVVALGSGVVVSQKKNR